MNNKKPYYELRYKSAAQLGSMLPAVNQTSTLIEAIEAAKNDRYNAEGGKIEIFSVTKKLVREA